MDFSIFTNWNEMAINEFHVNPTIFIFLMILTAPLLWFGLFWILKELYLMKKEKAGVYNLLIAVAFYLFFWALPYLYVIIYGENLPLIFWILFISFVIISLFLTYIKIKQKIINDKSNSSNFVWYLYSKGYDSLNHFRPYKELLDKVAEKLDIEDGDLIINYGCGTNNFEHQMMKVRKAKFVCLDYSESMMQYAKRKCPTCEYVQIDLKNNKYSAEKKFSKALSVNLIYNLSDLDLFFTGVRDNLKKEGIFVMTTSVKDGFGDLIKEHFNGIKTKELLKTILHILPFFYITLINVYLDRKFKGNFYTESFLKRKLESNGFKVLSSEVCYGGINTLIVAKAK